MEACIVLRADFYRSSACRSALLVAACVLLLSGRSQAAPLCTNGSLSDYLSIGSCSIGAATFGDFNLVTPLPTGATPIPTTQVTVMPFSTPSTVGFQFLFDVSASSGILRELLFGYNASVQSFTAANLAMTGASATNDGVVTAVQNVCIGDTYTAGSLTGCSTTEDANIVFAIDGDQLLTSAVLFAATPTLGIVNDIAVDGGLLGSAALTGSVTNSFNVVPEPTTGVLLATGLAWFLRSRSRRGTN
jgi:hypothetical protein